jgi:hypothetical protein
MSNAAMQPTRAAGESTSAGRSVGQGGRRPPGSRSVAGSIAADVSKITLRTALWPRVASPRARQAMYAGRVEDHCATQPTHSTIGRTSNPKVHANRLDEFLSVLGRNAPQPSVGLVISPNCTASLRRRMRAPLQMSDRAFYRQGGLHSAECSL